MGILKRIVRNSIVEFCLLLATGVVGCAAGESKVQQYNALIKQDEPVFGCGSNEVLDRVRGSANSKDNVAAIRIGAKTYLIVSSIIDGILYEYLRSPSTDATLPVERPVSVMDLLYLYTDNPNDPNDQSIIEGSDLAERVTNARRSATHAEATQANKNRTLVVEMMKTVVGLFGTQREELFINVDGDLNKKEGELEVILTGEGNRILPTPVSCPALGKLIVHVGKSLNGASQEDLENKKAALVDFLNRLRKYANDVAVIPDDENSDAEILKSTNHCNSHRAILLGEIGTQLEEIEFSPTDVLDTMRTKLARGMINLVRLVRGTWLEIGDIWRLKDGALKYGNDNTPNFCAAAIVHTEQMVDWLANKFRDDILVKFSGKAPCLKCSHYIQYAKKNSTPVKSSWNARTVIGFRRGWKDNGECKDYRYPIKFSRLNLANYFFMDGKRDWKTNRTNDNWGTKDGEKGSNCYCVEPKIGDGSSRIQMQSDGSMKTVVVPLFLPASVEAE
jgi:hypothetical protein